MKINNEEKKPVIKTEGKRNYRFFILPTSEWL